MQHTFLGRGASPEALYLDNFYNAFSGADQTRLLGHNPDGLYDSYMRYWNTRSERPLLSRMLYTDQKTYLVELLMKQDQMSMAASIESRVPFLDHEFVEFAAAVPERMKIRGKQGKYILKKAVEDLLPRDIIYRRKMGFPTPLRQWLMDPKIECVLNLLTDRNSILAEYVDGREVSSLLERHRAGLVDGTDRIWRLLNFHLWGELFIKGRRDRLSCGLLKVVQYTT